MEAEAKLVEAVSIFEEERHKKWIDENVLLENWHQRQKKNTIYVHVWLKLCCNKKLNKNAFWV